MNTKKHILIIGIGQFGKAISKAVVSSSDIHKITLVSPQFLDQEEANKTIKEISHNNPNNITFDSESSISNVSSSDIDSVFLSMPAKFIESSIMECRPLFENNNIENVCVFSKGIINNKENFLITNHIKHHLQINNIGVFSGPNFASDILSGCKSIATIAASNPDTLSALASFFKNSNIEIEESNDINGVQILGSIKNIIAIYIGYYTTKNNSRNENIRIFMKLYNEVKQVLKFFGCRCCTIQKSAGIGDMILTCFSEQSRNFSFGKKIANNEITNIEDYIKSHTVEGYYSALYWHSIFLHNNIELKYFNQVFEVLNIK